MTQHALSRQDLMDTIVFVCQKLFKKKLEENPNEFSYDDERLDRYFCLSTNEFRCHIHRYEKDSQYYAIRFDLFYNLHPGFDKGFLVIHNAYNNARFYIDDGDYGKLYDYDDDKVTDCLLVIYDVLLKLWLITPERAFTNNGDLLFLVSLKNFKISKLFQNPFIDYLNKR